MYLHRLKSFITVGCIFLCCSSFDIKGDGVNPRNYFLSSRRSGANLTLCSLIGIIKKPVGIFCNGRIWAHRTGRLDLELISYEPFIYREHEPFRYKELNNGVNRLVLLTRNPKELVFRMDPELTEALLDSNPFIAKLKTYMKRLQVFEEWDDKLSLIFFYEDVVYNLEESLLSMLELLEEEPVYLDEFMQNLEENLQTIHASYSQQWKGSGTSVVNAKPKLIHYSKGKPAAVLKKIDEILRNENPYLYDKYLKRFEYSEEMCGA